MASVDEFAERKSRISLLTREMFAHVRRRNRTFSHGCHQALLRIDTVANTRLLKGDPGPDMTPAILQRLNQPAVQAAVGHQFGSLSHHFDEQRIGALVNLNHIVEVANNLSRRVLHATSLPNPPQLLNPGAYELPAECDATFRWCISDRDLEHGRLLYRSMWTATLLAEPAWQVFIRDRLATALIDSFLHVVYATADLPGVSSAASAGRGAWWFTMSREPL